MKKETCDDVIPQRNKNYTGGDEECKEEKKQHRKENFRKKAS